MKITFKLFAILLSLFTIGCATHSSLNITCPADQTVELTTSPLPASAFNLEPPKLTGTCDDGGFTYSIGDFEKIYKGKNTLTYLGKNACGDEGSCLFVVNGVLKSTDFRDKFVGQYKGFRDCSALNTPQTQPDQNMTVTVSLGTDAKALKVENDQVPVDSTGAFPFPYISGYRSYHLYFRNDSIFLHQQWGGVNTNETCDFAGKKQ